MPITENTTERGYYWRYDHPPTEPEETFDMACGVAATRPGDDRRQGPPPRPVLPLPFRR
jgi:hypothetical protein